LYGGRWNSIGMPVVYVAESRSLAIIEMLVHLDSSAILNSYVLISAKLDESLVLAVEFDSLPTGWDAEAPSPETQRVGDRWIAAAESAALRVPSVLAPGEFNYLLNPRHPQFREIEMSGPVPYAFDRRLLR